jgi:hypothetical protein
MSLKNNIIYGGDIIESDDYPTFGDFLLRKLKDGGDLEALVNNFKQKYFGF